MSTSTLAPGQSINLPKNQVGAPTRGALFRSIPACAAKPEAERLIVDQKVARSPRVRENLNPNSTGKTSSYVQ